MGSGNRLISGIAALAIAATSAAVISPMMAVSGFDLYEPPTRMTIERADYMLSGGGGYSPGNAVTDNPTWMLEYPYHAVFFGAVKDGGSNNYLGCLYVVLSKVSVSSLFEFEYLPTRGRDGYLRATAKNRADVGYDKECVVLYQVVPISSTMNWYLRYFSDHVVLAPRDYYFDFDFYYPCCGSLEMNGARNVTECPYGYILTCQEPDGTGGGSQSGSSSGGSSGGDSSGGSSGGSSGSSSGEDSESDSSASWEESPGHLDDDESASFSAPEIPEVSRIPGWDLSDYWDNWRIPGPDMGSAVEGEADNFEKWEPGTSEWGYEEWKPGVDEWGVQEMLPGVSEWGPEEWSTDSEWGLQDWGPDGDWRR